MLSIAPIGRWIASSGQDVRFGQRTLRRSPLATAVMVASIAIGIGVATAVFTLADVMVMPGSRDQHALAACATIRVLAATMIHADQQLRAGAISPTMHEAIWWRVYRSMAPEASDSPGLDWSGSLR